MTISQPLLEPIIRAAGDIALTHFRDLKNLTIDKKVRVILSQRQI